MGCFNISTFLSSFKVHNGNGVYPIWTEGCDIVRKLRMKAFRSQTSRIFLGVTLFVGKEPPSLSLSSKLVQWFSAMSILCQRESPRSQSNRTGKFKRTKGHLTALKGKTCGLLPKHIWTIFILPRLISQNNYKSGNCRISLDTENITKHHWFHPFPTDLAVPWIAGSKRRWC